MLLYRLILRNEQLRFTSTFQLPTSQVIDRPLIVGALIFGLGWGLGGFCPGPGLTSIFSGNVNPILFCDWDVSGNTGCTKGGRSADPQPG